MMIGPDPIRRIEEMSSRLGIAGEYGGDAGSQALLNDELHAPVLLAAFRRGVVSHGRSAYQASIISSTAYSGRISTGTVSASRSSAACISGDIVPYSSTNWPAAS